VTEGLTNVFMLTNCSLSCFGVAEAWCHTACSIYDQFKERKKWCRFDPFVDNEIADTS